MTLDQCGWLGPDALVTAPPPELAEVVEHAFVLDMRFADAASWMVLPDPSAHLLVHLTWRPDGSMRTTSSVVGPRTHSIAFHAGSRAWTVGLRLRPGALPLLTGLPASELTNRSASLGSVWGAQGDRIEHSLAGAPGPQRMPELLLDLVRMVSAGSTERDWRARSFERLLTQAGGSCRVENLASRMGISARSLRVRSGELIGVPPKRYARIHRLHGAIDRAKKWRVPAWARVAAASGFADQSHMTREFNDLLGESPARFHRRRRRDADSFNRPDGRGRTFA